MQSINKLANMNVLYPIWLFVEEKVAKNNFQIFYRSCHHKYHRRQLLKKYIIPKLPSDI